LQKQTRFGFVFVVVFSVSKNKTK